MNSLTDKINVERYNSLLSSKLAFGPFIIHFSVQTLVSGIPQYAGPHVILRRFHIHVDPHCNSHVFYLYFLIIIYYFELYFFLTQQSTVNTDITAFTFNYFYSSIGLQEFTVDYFRFDL